VHALAVAVVLLHGLVVRGPTKPLCEMTTPCVEPAAHVTLVFARRGAVAARVTTDTAGRYRVRLRRGTYSVRLASPQRIGRGLDPTKVAVRTPRRVDFTIDTGIR
jgi:hypothetical protein